MATVATPTASTSNSTSSWPRIPPFLARFYAKFPLYTYPDPQPTTTYENEKAVHTPALWIHPPSPDLILPQTNLLSADVECLKWQAYLALRGVSDIGVRWDVHPRAGIDGRLPSLQIADGGGDLLGARAIPGWVDDRLGGGEDAFEGYKDEQARDESRAWVALLEGPVHAALLLFSTPPSLLETLISYVLATRPLPNSGTPLAATLPTPPAPLSGLLSLLPPFGERVSPVAVEAQYLDAIRSIAERLGNDEWFLGSSSPTAIDALLFAYLHCLMQRPGAVRTAVTRRLNLVTWERKVMVRVQSAFVATGKLDS